MIKRTASQYLFLFIFSAIIIVISSCGSGKKNAENLPPGTHSVGVIEVIQTTNYTYLKVEENDNPFWIAIVRRDAKPGDVIYYTQAYEMKDFVSKELGRTFPTVFFVQDPSDRIPGSVETTQQPQQMPAGKGEAVRNTNISVKMPGGGIDIADLYKNKDKYAGKTVKIRGVVVKYNKEIMGKNWAHIQDGTDYSGKFDLAVTTADSVELDNEVTFTGIITLNKDFGAGYFYDVIMEDAKAADIRAN